MAPSRPRSLRTFTFGSSKSPLSPSPPSPTFSDATNTSAMNFGANGPSKIITRANLKASIQAYEDLLGSCFTYRAALVTMSKATAAFADAIERCSGLKGPNYEAGTRLQAASGMQHLIGNLHHVLADTLDHSFERPLRQQLEAYRTIVHDRSQSYERSLREKSQIIRDTEMRSLNRKERNLQSFREALVILQQQVDDLDELKATHYQEIVEHEEKVWDAVQSKVCVLVRSTMDVFDRVTAKASDPIIEPMLQSVPDPFDSYGPKQSEDQIFSILAPLSIMNVPSPSPSPVAGTPETEATPMLLTSSHPKIASWLPGTSDGLYPVESAEWATASPPTSPPPLSNLSPPSNRRNTPSQRKLESKLRSVLPSIEETRPSLLLSTRPPPPPDTSEILKTPIARSASSLSNSASVSATPLVTPLLPQNSLSPAATTATTKDGIGGGGMGTSASGFGFGLGTWSFGYGQSPYSYNSYSPPPPEDDYQSPSTTASTPRLSTAFAPHQGSSSPSPPPPGSPPSLDLGLSDGSVSDEKREGDSQTLAYDPVPT